jgi:hypothetical protein
MRIRVLFREEEKRDPDLGFERVLLELKKRAEAAPDPKRVLLIFDNVDKPELLAPAQTQHLPAADWLHGRGLAREWAPAV